MFYLFFIFIWSRGKSQVIDFFSQQAAPNQVEAKGDLGLVKGHAYSVTGAAKVRKQKTIYKSKNFGLYFFFWRNALLKPVGKKIYETILEFWCNKT